jgi:hypothetical protein
MNPAELCPKNVNCSSNGMDAVGLAQIVESLFLNYYEAYICEYMDDNNSSTQNVL